MKKGLLLIALILSLVICPLFSYGNDYDDDIDDYQYYDMSDEEFEELIDNLTYEDINEFLVSLSDEELFLLLDAAGMSEEEFQEIMEDFYSYEDDYEDDDEWDFDDYYDEDEEDYDYDDDDEWDYEKWNDYFNNKVENPAKKDKWNKDENSKNTHINTVTSNNIGQRVCAFAEEYTKKDTWYVSGGQGKSSSNGIDCSGLVISCYLSALENTNYKLPFKDTSAYYLYSKYTEPTSKPEAGDLIFMSYDWGEVDHVGIFEEFKDGKVYFIDATLNHTNKSGRAVNKRSYPVQDDRVISYGKMKLVSK